MANCLELPVLLVRVWILIMLRGERTVSNAALGCPSQVEHVQSVFSKFRGFQGFNCITEAFIT